MCASGPGWRSGECRWGIVVVGHAGDVVVVVVGVKGGDSKEAPRNDDEPLI